MGLMGRMGMMGRMVRSLWRKARHPRTRAHTYCPSWRAVEGMAPEHGGECLLGRGGGRPSAGVCRVCLGLPPVPPVPPVPVKPRRGLGDRVAGIFRGLGVKECAGCARRRKWLDRLLRI